MNFRENAGNSGRSRVRYPGDRLRDLFETPALNQNAVPLRILICRPNHRLGNLLLVTPILQEVSKTFPNCKIDLFVKGELGPRLFKNYGNINQIIQLPRRPFEQLLTYLKGWIQIIKNRYDVAINVDQSSSSGRLAIFFANSRFKIMGTVIEDLKEKHFDYEHHAKFPVYNFWNHWGRIEHFRKDRQIPSLDLRLETSEIGEGKKILRDLVGNDHATICLFTFATGKKCYSTQWWDNFYEKLIAEVPNVNIIEVLPLHNVSGLSSKIKTFYSTDIRQIGSVIANSALFIGADSGIMHLASSVHTPTVGLFSVTDPTRYAPYGNGSIAFDTNSAEIGECLRPISAIISQSRYEVHHQE